LSAAAGGLFAASSLQTGLLDPIPLLHRSVNLVLLSAVGAAGGSTRVCVAGWTIALLLFAAVLLNLWIPRFYCRFVCPLGALFGLLVRWTPWRVGKRQVSAASASCAKIIAKARAIPLEKSEPANASSA